MENTQFILNHLDKITTNVEELVNYLIDRESVIYVDEKQDIDYVSKEKAYEIMRSFGNYCASEMIGKTDYILVYDASKVISIEGEQYLPAGYLVMKADSALESLSEEDINVVLPEVRSRICTLALGQYRIQAYKLG